MSGLSLRKQIENLRADIGEKDREIQTLRCRQGDVEDVCVDLLTCWERAEPDGRERAALREKFANIFPKPLPGETTAD